MLVKFVQGMKERCEYIMGKIYGYCRISTKHQEIGRQQVNILRAYPTAARLQNIPFTLTPNTNEYRSVSLDWSQYNYTNKNFKVYKSSDGGNTYETVGIDYKSVKKVKCLQVYPADGAANQLKVWMENNGYGKGIIKVDSVSIE